MRRNDRKVGKRPFAALDLHALRRYELQQMADRRREHIIPALVIITVAREAPQRPRDVVRDGGLFGDDEFFGHGEKDRRGEPYESSSPAREAQNDKSNRNAKQETATRSRSSDGPLPAALVHL